LATAGSASAEKEMNDLFSCSPPLGLVHEAGIGFFPDRVLPPLGTSTRVAPPLVGPSSARRSPLPRPPPRRASSLRRTGVPTVRGRPPILAEAVHRPEFSPRPSVSAVAPPRVAGSVSHWHASMGPRGLAHAAGWCQLGWPFGGQCPGQPGRRLPTHRKSPPWDWGCGATLFPVVNSFAAHSASAGSSRTEEPWNQGCTRDVAFH